MVSSDAAAAGTTLKKRHNAAKNEEEEEKTKISTKNGAATPSTNKQQQQPFKLISLLGGIGGMVDFSILKAPGWVDLSRPPGTTSQLDMYMENPKLWTIITGYYILFSPNLVWLIIAALVYVYAPYDYESAAREGWSLEWYLRRAALNSAIMFGYFGFWHYVLYIGQWAKRPFAKGRVYRWSKTIHNAFYCWLGVLQWTAWEMIMVHNYATGRIGYQKDEDILSGDPKEIFKFFLGIITVPIYRECQFFFAHRFIHLRCLYKYIHSLHHRNTDVEPFSGLCMSPAEHIYYISSVGPSIYWHASPFQFLWNGIHLVISPGASHSGWEDHWHSDQYHCAHHRYFECNYGTPGLPFDRWFGTFRETMAPQTNTYKGNAIECISPKQEDQDDSKEGMDDIITARPDTKSTLWGLPSWDQMLYHVAIGIGLPLFTMYATTNRDSDMIMISPTVAALVVSVGPLMLAATLSIITANPSSLVSLEKFRYMMLYPQHNEPLLGLFSVGLIMGFLLSIMPTFHFFHSLFVPNIDDTAYNRIWG